MFDVAAQIDMINEDSADGHSVSKMKMDLSMVSFLKPHVMNPSLYKLAHEGHSRQQLRKTEAIKEIEKTRRYRKLIQSREKSNEGNTSVEYSRNKALAFITTSTLPKTVDLEKLAQTTQQSAGL